MVWPDVYHYAIPFFTLILSGFALPVPEEMVLTAAGVLCGRDAQIYWQVMIPVCILGIAIGDSALYFIGWMWGPSWLKKPGSNGNSFPKKSVIKSSKITTSMAWLLSSSLESSRE